MPEYAALAARTREKPTFASAEDVIKKDYPLKLPSRVHIQLWNTPEVSQFRGYQDDLDESEKRRPTVRQEQQDIGIAAREACTQVLPSMDLVHEMLNQQRQSATALGQQAADLANATRQQMAGWPQNNELS